jgi:predicted enzyme related to lactoylglutathione lyase
MAQVLGVGGVFFKAADPTALCDWYRRVLGFEISDNSFANWAYPAMGYTVWCAFQADTTYFAPSRQGFMINLIVDDLDGVLARAKAEGVEPVGQDYADDNGCFAWLIDPAGIKVELWEPHTAEPPP